MSLATDTGEATSSDADVISLTIPASLRFVRLARIAVASIARRRGLPIRAIDDLRLAVDEAFSLLLGEEDQAGENRAPHHLDAEEIAVGALLVAHEMRRHAEIATGPQDPQGDLSSIGDQNLAKHTNSLTRAECRGLSAED